MLRELLRESEKRNKEMVVLLKHNLDEANEMNKELVATITGKNYIPRDPSKPSNVIQPRPVWSKRKKQIEKADLEAAIKEREEAAGLAEVAE